MYRVTIATTDDGLADSLVEPLRAEGFEVVRLTVGEDEEILDPAAAPDVLVLDVRGPTPVTRPLHADAWPDASIIAVLAPRQVASLDPATGLDDFIAGPIQVDELLARVHQSLWRHGRGTSRNTIAAGDLVLDLTNYHVFEAGRPITLTYKEYELLRFLMTHSGTVFNRETLLNRVWGYNYYGGSRTVDVHVRRLRSKLDGSHYDYIETVRNVGYRFAQPLR